MMCRNNLNCFYGPHGEAPRGKAYGKVSYPKKIAENGKIIAEEYAVRKSYVESILAEKRFPNKRTCIKEWKQEGVLDCDGDRPTRSRKIVPEGKSEDVYVFRVYADPQEAIGNDTASDSPKLQLLSQRKTTTLNYLLSDDDGDNGEGKSDDGIA